MSDKPITTGGLELFKQLDPVERFGDFSTGFEDCEFIGDPPAPYGDWISWIMDGGPYRGVRVSALSPSGPSFASAAMHDVCSERARQVTEEGFSSERDDFYVYAELAKAAASYAIVASLSDERRVSVSGHFSIQNNEVLRNLWPWPAAWWKPTDRRRDLVKAAALLVAEIERLDRAAAKAVSP